MKKGPTEMILERKNLVSQLKSSKENQANRMDHVENTESGFKDKVSELYHSVKVNGNP